jgi:hypothetical protein
MLKPEIMLLKNRQTLIPNAVVNTVGSDIPEKYPTEE